MTDQQRIRASITDLFSNVSTATELETRLSMMDRLPKGYKIWIQIVYLSGSVEQIIRKSSYETCKHRFLKDGGVVLEVIKSIGRKKKTRLDGFLALLPSTVENIYRVISISDSLFWLKLGSRFIERAYPTIVRIFFRQAELKQTLLYFEQSLADKLEIQMTDMILKERRFFLKRVAKGDDEFDSERRWTISPIKKAFEDAEQRRQWFKSVRLDLKRREKNVVVATVRMTKHGLISQDYLYEVSQKYLLPNLEKIAFTKTELFSKRGLRERNYLPANPVSIDYFVDVFHEKANVRKLASVLKAYPNSSKAVYHGNPYLHVSLADFTDGSSFDIWVLSPRRIILIPQAKASVPSFEKLVSYVFEQFKEGEAKEYTHG